ncbi:hypothetical protein WCP94_003362 [Bilophila wadsworthia]
MRFPESIPRRPLPVGKILVITGQKNSLLFQPNGEMDRPFCHTAV